MQQGVQMDATSNIPTMLHLFTQGFMAETKCETGEKNVLYIQGCDDLISTEMCGCKIIHELV